MECSFYVQLQVSQDTQISCVNCYSKNVSFCCDFQWQVLKGYILLQTVIHLKQKTKKSQKISVLWVCINGEDWSPDPANPLCWLFLSCAYYLVHIIKRSWIGYGHRQSLNKGEALAESGLRRSNPLACSAHHLTALNLLPIQPLWSNGLVCCTWSIHSLVQAITWQ